MFSRFNAGQEGTLWYYGALAELFDRRLPGPLARELLEAVTQLQAIAGTSAQGRLALNVGETGLI